MGAAFPAIPARMWDHRPRPLPAVSTGLWHLHALAAAGSMTEHQLVSSFRTHILPFRMPVGKKFDLALDAITTWQDKLLQEEEAANTGDDTSFFFQI